MITSVSIRTDASLDIHPPNLVVTQNIFAGQIPPTAEVRLFVPDPHYATYNPNLPPGYQQTGAVRHHPDFGPLQSFTCSPRRDFTIALKPLSNQLSQFKQFDFFEPAAALDQYQHQPRAGFCRRPRRTIGASPPRMARRSICSKRSSKACSASPPTIWIFGGIYAGPNAHHRQHGCRGGIASSDWHEQRAPLPFAALAAVSTASRSSWMTARSPPARDAAIVDNYDVANKVVTIRYNATYTTATKIKNEVHAKYLAVNTRDDAVRRHARLRWTPKHGSGTVHHTALKMELRYHLAYSNAIPMAFGRRSRQPVAVELAGAHPLGGHC